MTRSRPARATAGQCVLTGEAIDTDHLDYAYALTVHRAQGATYDRAHVLAAGGGRELAYVALSRARDRTTIHATADDLAQAVDDLQADWSVEHHQRWITDTPAEVGQHPDPIRADLDELQALLSERFGPDLDPPDDALSKRDRLLRRLDRLEAKSRDTGLGL